MGHLEDVAAERMIGKVASGEFVYQNIYLWRF